MATNGERTDRWNHLPANHCENMEDVPILGPICRNWLVTLGANDLWTGFTVKWGLILTRVIKQIELGDDPPTRIWAFPVPPTNYVNSHHLRLVATLPSYPCVVLVRHSVWPAQRMPCEDIKQVLPSVRWHLRNSSQSSSSLDARGQDLRKAASSGHRRTIGISAEGILKKRSGT